MKKIVKEFDYFYHQIMDVLFTFGKNEQAMIGESGMCSGCSFPAC